MIINSKNGINITFQEIVLPIKHRKSLIYHSLLSSIFFLFNGENAKLSLQNFNNDKSIYRNFDNKI